MTTTATVNVSAIQDAKEAYNQALLKQVEPIDKQIAELKSHLATLETSKRTIEAQVKLIDKKPSEGRVWSAEAKAKLSASLKAAAARKKAAAAQNTSQEGTANSAAVAAPALKVTTPQVPDFKSRAAADDSSPAVQTTKKNRSVAR
jgi:hypothetical protein